MNGEIPSVPITTLAGVASLTDLLPQLPLPTPLPSTVSNSNLLFDPRVAEEARRILATSDDSVVQLLVQSLKNTTTESIELKDSLATDVIEGEVPELLKAILVHNPNAFKGAMPSSVAQSFDNVDHTRQPVSTIQHNRQPPTPQLSNQTSPYASGYSPFPPSSPSRYSQPSQSPKYIGANNSHSQHGSPYSHSQTGAQSASKFQQQFQSFAAAAGQFPQTNSGVSPTLPVNGGIQVNSSPTGTTIQQQTSMSPPQIRAPPQSQTVKPATVSSPAQATSAPLTPEIQRKDPTIPHHMPPQSSKQFDNNQQSISETPNKKHLSSDTKPTSPVLRKDDANMLNMISSPILKLTRIDDPSLDDEHSRLKIKRKRNKMNKEDGVYEVISSKNDQANRLTLKLSKRQMCANEVPLSPLPKSDVFQSVSPDIISTMSVPTKLVKTEDLSHNNSVSADSKTSSLSSKSSHDRSHKTNKTMDTNHQERDHESSKRSEDRTHHHQHHKSEKPHHPESNNQTRKRKLSTDTSEPPSPIPAHETIGEFTLSLSERVKRRRRTVQPFGSAEDDASNDADVDVGTDVDVSADVVEVGADVDYVERTVSPETHKLNKETTREREKKLKRKERDKSRMVVLKPLTTDELMESGTFKRFVGYIDEVIETTEDLNLGTLNIEDDDTEVPNDILMARSLVADLCSEAAKLKSVGVMRKIPRDKLIKLMTILQWNIKDASKLIPCMPNGDENEDQLWRELTLDRVTRSIDSALISMYIMTSPHMPKQVYIEDVIERCVALVKYQMINSIFPEYDPVYRPSNKDYHGSLKAKRARAGQVKSKIVLTMYNKVTELVGILAELVELQELTDTVVLQISSLGVSPFFVENVSELQLSAIKLVTKVFSHYEKHRTLIIEDIFASLARLPSSKRKMRSYRLNADESIQMVTALVLQLMQCVVLLPKVEEKSTFEKDKESERKDEMDKDLIVTSYETSMRTGHSFLSVFLRKCAIKGDEDFRPLFENFVHDLLTTVNKPEWPAAELLLSLLGRLLVQQFSNKSVDMSLRVASLDYLGTVAARLRKDAVSSHLNQETLEEIMEQINDSDDEEAMKQKRAKNHPDMDYSDTTQVLQKSLLEYLGHNASSDPCYYFARQFYIAQWFRDCSVQMEKANKGKTPEKSKKKARRREESSDEDEHDSVHEGENDDAVKEYEKMKEILGKAEKGKRFILSCVKVHSGPFASYKPSRSSMDYEHACWVSKYLASNRPFSQSFDIYLTQILKVLCETAVAVRTKAMKCLTSVVEADPGILARPDMQRGVHGRFLDQSTSVREAAVELVGKFILIRPELINQYYEMLSKRILDTGISVRKRVIKIFRDICLEQPDFPKIPEMCVRMIRRVNDEEGIKKLVSEVFQNMWFTPLSSRERSPEKLVRRVINISEVVSACRDTGLEWIEQLIEALLKKEEDQSSHPVLKSCQQIVDCLVENVLSLEEQDQKQDSAGKKISHRLVACMATLHLFSKVHSELLVNHSMTLQPYLNIKCVTESDFLVIHYIAQILQVSVPLMDHPSESFLAQLEEDMMKLILKHGMMVLQSCVSCLGAIVNNVSHNYKLVTDCFQKFFGVLSRFMTEHQNNPTSPALNSRPTLLRSLYTIGLLCTHFDFDSKEMGDAKLSIRDSVFDVLMYFKDHEDEDIRHKALCGLGFFCIRHYDIMLGTRLKEYYISLLTLPSTSVKITCQVLRNLQQYLLEEEARMIISDHEWKKHAKSEDLKEMGDIQSGMASTVMQAYLKKVLEAFFNHNVTVRSAALSVICLVLRQGLVHPVQCVPYLVSMGTDTDQIIRTKADQQLSEIEKKYPGFIQMKALAGVKMSYQLQKIIYNDTESVMRGCRDVEPSPQSLNAFLYSVVRSVRSQRRALLSSLLNLFDDTAKTPLCQLLYMADNIAYFPYQLQDEPLYIIHQIDILVSVSGSNLVQSFREILFPEKIGPGGVVKIDEDEEEDDVNALLGRLPKDVEPVQELCQVIQGCILLLVLKQHVKEMYGFTDHKVHQYSPNEAAKVYDRPVTRRNVRFDPKQALDVLKQGLQKKNLDEKDKRLLIEEYLDFKYLMMNIDPSDDDSEDGGDAGSIRGSGRCTPVAQESRKAAGDNCQESGEKIDEGGAGDSNRTPVEKTISHSRQNTHHYVSKHRHLLLDKKRTPSAHTSSSSSKSRPKTTISSTPLPKPKKKKKKKRIIVDSDEGSDDDEDVDPNFVC